MLLRRKIVTVGSQVPSSAGSDAPDTGRDSDDALEGDTVTFGEMVTIQPETGPRESQVPSTSNSDEPDPGVDSDDTSEGGAIIPSPESSDQLAGESDTNLVGPPSQEHDSQPSSGAPQELIPGQEPPKPTPAPSENGDDITAEGFVIKTEESSAISTITALPVGARIETLTGGFTEGTVITTTSSGSSDSTVVPIIVPLGLPPLICWGCIPSFPGNIRIKIPEFCIDVLGFKIGNCPAGEDNENSGGDEAGGNPGEPEDPQNPDEPTSTTSCTATVVAAYESVFCSVTEVAGARKHRMRREELTDCSTLAYTTTTACETVAGSTTTTIFPQETDRRCTPDTCGGGSCPVEKRDLELYKRMRPWPEESPAENTWADPADYGGNTQEFMRGEVATAHDKPKTFVRTTGSLDSTSNWLQFSNRVGTMGVKGLIGCTAVVVISRQGAWVGHFWERGYQERDVVPYLQTGKAKVYWNQYGVKSLRNNDALVPHGHIFDDANEPRVFIMAPRAEADLPNGGGPDNSETAGGNVLRYEDFVERLKADLRNIFGEGSTVPITTVQYSPIRFAPTPGDWRDDAWETHRGKLLVQYQPAQGTCRPEAKWRVWFEGRPLEEDHQDQWVPSDSQRIAKRQETCPDAGNGGHDAENGDSGAGDGDESTDALTATTTAAEETPTPTPTILEPPGLGQGECSVAQDCMPAIICTGRTVNACEDGKCVCNPPSAGEPNCAAAADCKEILNCDDGMVGNCQGGQCVCEPPEPPSQRPTDGGGSNPRTCKLHLREYYDHAVMSNKFFVKYKFENSNPDDQPLEGSYSDGRWNEEYLVPTSETGLEHPISVTLSTDLPPGVDETICVPGHIPSGGKIHKRCFDTQWRMYMVKLKYGDLEWDSRPNQDVTATPRCQVGDWDFGSWEGINKAYPNREMDCIFPC
ncbi:uncharacterized protein DNG_08866 [Cephalotrichum gorgonifer]|uniref:Uncharacterized protein n=1 Tax=Cephalotrichum gorgonifer TaxID=2041049 RepID=A0AAE8N797_9PEZI|nr:uncharacterized protein DNG_08866 [Cephalotrichum gorgonifer]